MFFNVTERIVKIKKNDFYTPWNFVENENFKAHAPAHVRVQIKNTPDLQNRTTPLHPIVEDVPTADRDL